MLDFLLTSDAIMALLTLTFLEIILGIDNIVFISIAANKLPEDQRSKATNIGLLLAMVQRIILLFFVTFLVGLSKPFYSLETSWFEIHISWQAIILLSGGLFLIYKSTSEIREKVTDPDHDEDEVKNKNFGNNNQFFSPKDDYINLSEAVRDFPNLYEIPIHSDKDYRETLEKLHLQLESIPLFVKTTDNNIYVLSEFETKKLPAKDTILVYVGQEI